MSKNILFFISSLNGGAENQLYKLFELLKDENEARYVVAKAENSNSNIIGKEPAPVPKNGLLIIMLVAELYISILVAFK